MKKVFVLAIMAASLFMVDANAQKMNKNGKGKGNAPKMEQMSEDPNQWALQFRDRLAKEVNLGASQAEAVYGIALNHAKNRASLKESGKENREAMKASRDAFQTELKKVLSPEQVAILESRQEDRMEKRQENKGGEMGKGQGKKGEKMGKQGRGGEMGQGKKGGKMGEQAKGGGRPDPATMASRMKENLTQKLNLDTQQAEAVYQAALKQAQTFQANKDVQGQARGEAMRASREAFVAELKKILTPVQWTAFEQLKEERQEKRGGDKK